MKRGHLICAAAMSIVRCVAAAAGPDLANPALNPVTPLPAFVHSPVALVKDGVPRFTLVWDRSASGRSDSTVREAVRTLRREFRFCTGAEIAVYDESRRGSGECPRSPVVLVGRSRHTDALGLHTDNLSPEGFSVTTFSNGVAIVGNNAALWGAYDFLERVLGCRYYYPGSDGTVRPACSNLVLSPFAYTDAPRFRNRGGLSSKMSVEVASRTVGVPLVRANISAWLAASRLAATEAFVSMHSPDPCMWAAARPDLVDISFFRSSDGQMYHNPTNHYGNYFDVTNLKFADVLAEALAENDTPEGRRRLGFAHNDDRIVVFGQCDSFRSLDEMQANPVVKREGLITQANIALGPCGYFSDVYARFYQRFADQVNRRLPGRTVIFMPYAGCTYAPTQERFRRLPRNVELGVCLPKVPRFIRNPAVRGFMARELHRWTEVLGGRPVRQIWTYNALNGIFDQAVAYEFLPEAIAAFGTDLGDAGINLELSPYPLNVEGQCVPLHFYYETYCAFRTLWGGARFNPDAALDEHWRLFYGKEAGAHLKRAHGLIKAAFLVHGAAAAKVRALFPTETLGRIEDELDVAGRILSCDKSAPEWRRFKLMSNPLYFELDMQRQRKAGLLPKEAPPVRFIAGQEGPPWLTMEETESMKESMKK